VILEATLDAAHGDAEIAAWRAHVVELTGALGWRVQMAVRRDVGGAALADGPGYAVRAALGFTAPIDALFAATLINEWAWMRASAGRGSGSIPADGGSSESPAEEASSDDPLPCDFPAALARARMLIAEESNPALIALRDRAAREDVPFIADEDLVSVGYGAKGEHWPARALPPAEAVDWNARGTIPVALVTGSNGKTTTTRLVAAMLTNAGHTVGFCCSDGVFIAGTQVESGDWSGPAGAKRVLRDSRVTAAVLETARGGLLRRGLVVPRADAAIITNIAADHFGGYGIHSLADLAAVKLVVARAVGATGTLVLNGDDATLRAAHMEAVDAEDARGAAPATHRTTRIEWFGEAVPLESVPAAAEMPIAFGGAARYNMLNAIGAAHVARALGVAADVVAQTLREFGRDNADNPGRLERHDVRGVRVWIDYAHNPHGLAALLNLCTAEAQGGRIGLLLGQAGDRDDDAIRALARTAWDPRRRRPDRIVLKDVDGYLRGRAPGDVPELLRTELLAAGAPAERLSVALDEISGVRALLDWARAGDLLVLPVHNLDARKRAIQLLREPGAEKPTAHGID
jgi:cyanophycin synthetase